jgi:hypothetical protein
VKRHLVAVIASAAVLAGCGGHTSSTRLKIEVGDSHGVRAYRLTCAPAGGTAPHPAAICAELRKEPKLLVGGWGISHSCPSGNDEAFRVSGRYRGYAIDATFPPSACAFVPGQDDAAGVWSYLLDDAGPGVAEREFGHARPTEADRERARALIELRGRTRRLRAERLLALKTGKLELGTAPDKTALDFLRDSSRTGPEPFDAQIYTTTRGKLGAEFRFGSRPDTKVYVLVLHYAYRDYTGRRHRADDPAFSVYDAQTLEVTDFGYPAPPLRRLGAPVTLTF